MATEAEMESVFEEVKTIDASLQQDCLQKKCLMKAKDFQNFMKDHSHRSTYAYQLRKYSLDTCAYCSSHPFACHWRNSTLSAIFLFQYLMLADSTLSISRKSTVSYHMKKIDHPWGTRTMLMTNSIKLIAKLFLQLEGSEQQ